jgi:predicted DNA-binding protein with PD1-like motif
MRCFSSEGLGRIIVMNFERGEELLKGVRDQVAKLGIKNAVILNAIGTLEKAVYHRVSTMDAKPVEQFITVNKPIELSSVQGMVIDGQPHFHMTFTDLEKTYSGHLEDGTIVLYLAEIVLAEMKGLNLFRKKNELNIALLTEKSQIQLH